MTMRSLCAAGVVLALVACRDRSPTSTEAGAAPGVPTYGAMAAGPIVHTLLASGNNGTNQRTYTTAAITPAANALITVAVLQHRSGTASPSPIVTGGGMVQWVEVATVTFGTVGAPHKRATIFRAMSATPGSGPITIQFGASQSNCQWIVSQWTSVDAGGVNGAGAIVQSGAARGDAVNGLTVSLAAFESAGNVAYGVFGVNARVAAVTPGGGFTEIAEHASAENPGSDLAAEWAPGDNSIDASWTALDGGALGIEIRAGEPPPPPVPVASVQVSPAAATVVLGGTVQLTATAFDASGNVLTGRAFTWQSDDNGVARVSANGLVTGVAAGPATITATAEGISGASDITVTAPPPGSPVVLVGAGDIADCSELGDEATAALLDNIQGTVFTTGDNAYPNGSTTDFTGCYQPSWGRHLARTRPAPGNHDYNTSGAAGYFAYYGLLAGEPGRGYYSYDVGDWHVISLNSNISMSAGSAQEVWLRADLAASTKACTIAYWHHPRFSSGTNHGGRSATQPLWQALYDAGAEIVIAGHEHNYERFAPQTPTGEADPVAGIRQFVVGTGGASRYNDLGTPLPTSEIFNGTTWGVLKLTLGAGTYTWEFIPVAGQTFTDAGSGTCHSADPVRVSASPTAIPASDGSSVATITVTVKGADGAPVSGATVTLSATGSGNTITQPGPTDASGATTGTLSSTVAEAKTVSATVDAVPVAQTVTLTVTPAGAATLAFVTEPTNAAAATPISPPVRVEVRDRFGNRVTNAPSPITLAIGANPSGGTLLGTTTVAAVAGLATFGDLSIDLGGVGYTLRATSGTLTEATSTAFDIVGGSISAALSTVSADPATIGASTGSSVATITVTVRDGSGLPVDGATVTLAATGSGNTITPAAGSTDAGGVMTATISSTVIETKTVTATANGVALVARPTVVVTAGSPDASRSTVTASPATIVVGGTAAITVTVKDALGNPLSGSTVELATTGTNYTLTDPAAPTDLNGVATGTLSSGDAQTFSVSATVDGLTLIQTASVTVMERAPVSIAHTLLTTGNNTVNQKIYTTASVSPTPNALITLAVLGHNSTSAPASPVVTGGGVTAWTEVASITFDAVGLPLKRLTVFRAMSASPGSGPITITWGVSVSNCQWIVSAWTGVDAGGENGAGAIAQTASQRADAVSGLAATLAPFAAANDVAYGVFATNASGLVIAPGAGFTEIGEVYSTESPRAVLEAEWGVNRNTVDASWSGLLRAAVLAIQIRAAGP